jgi:hypothetical protein
MADYRPGGSYTEDESAFDGFVRKAFPIGSEAHDAVEKISHENFLVVGSTPNWFRLGPTRPSLQRDLFDRHPRER